MARIQIVMASALVLVALVVSPFFQNLGRAFSSDGLDYSQRRVIYGFNHLPVDRIAAALSAYVASGESVALGPNLAKNDFFSQRLSEGLYPVRIDRNAALTLDLATANSTDGLTLLKLGDTYTIKLLGKTAAPRAVTPPNESFDFSIFAFILAALSAIGWGALALAVLKIRPEPKIFFCQAALTGAVVIALIASLSTWAQLAIPLKVTLWLSLAGLALVRPAKFSNPFCAPEAWGLAALIALFFMRLALFPVTMWDGRSVWLFAAKKFFFNGMLTRADLLRPEYEFSNPSYPLLFPSWLSHFSSLSNVYNERLAALGIAVLFAAILGALWVVLRERFGRWTGAALTAAFYLMSENLAGGAYVDTLLMLFTALGFLALSIKTYESIGWIALMASSLIKVEGLAVALAIAGCFVISRRVRPVGLIVFLPALVHRLWTKAIGVRNIFSEVSFSTVRDESLYRVGAFLEELPRMMTTEGYTAIRYILWLALVALLISVMILAKYRKIDWASKAALGLAIGFFAMACVVTALVPFEVAWFMNVTVDRLLLHPAVLLLLTPFFVTACLEKRSSR